MLLFFLRGHTADGGRINNHPDFAGKKPLLGICLGHQAIAEAICGKLGLAPKVSARQTKYSAL